MKIQLNRAILILPAIAALGFFAAAVRAQQNTTGHANNFTSVEYFDPPHQQQMKSRMAGAEAQPQGQLLVIKDMKLELFDTNGVKQVTIKAPHCVYDTQKGEANSPGHLWLETGDGTAQVEGDGFLWRQNSSFLTISNHVHTVIEKTPELKAQL